MSTFKRILAEKSRDYGRKGGQTPTIDASTRATLKKNLERTSRRTKSSRSGGQGFGSSKDSAARYAGKPDVNQQAKVADDIRSRVGADPTPRKAASNIIGGGKGPDAADELVGGETAKSGKGQRYRQVRPSDVRASGIKSNDYADWQRQAVRARRQLKTTGVKFFGSPSGVDAQGKPTYVPSKQAPKGSVGRRAQRQPSSSSYSDVKAEIDRKLELKKPKSVTPPTPKNPTVTSFTPTKKIQPLVNKSKVTGGVPRATDVQIPKIRPTATKTFAQFATSGRTAAQKQATLKALRTPPKTTTRVKVTAPPKPKALTRAAVTPKVKAPKIGPAGIAGRALGAVGAGFEVVQGRDDAKKAGASDTRAWLRGAARAAGGLAGGSLGAAGGGFIGGIAGYSGGSALADKTFTALAGATQAQKDWMKQANLDSQKGTAVDKVKYRKGNQAVIYDPRVNKERIGTLDKTTGRFKAANIAKSKSYTAKNPFERLGRQFSRSNEGSGLFGMNIVKGGALADMAKTHYANKDERKRAQRVSDFKKSASTK